MHRHMSLQNGTIFGCSWAEVFYSFRAKRKQVFPSWFSPKLCCATAPVDRYDDAPKDQQRAPLTGSAYRLSFYSQVSASLHDFSRREEYFQ